MNLGFGVGGQTASEITLILIGQFSAMHTLQIMRMIVSLVIYIQPTKYLDDNLKNRFIHGYKGVVEETLQMLDKNK
jgi:hypothetical protein